MQFSSVCLVIFQPFEVRWKTHNFLLISFVVFHFFNLSAWNVGEVSLPAFFVSSISRFPFLVCNASRGRLNCNYALCS